MEQQVSFDMLQCQEHIEQEEELVNQEIDLIRVQKEKDLYTSSLQLKQNSHRDSLNPSKYNHQHNILGWETKSLVRQSEDQQATGFLGKQVIYSTCQVNDKVTCKWNCRVMYS